MIIWAIWCIQKHYIVPLSYDLTTFQILEQKLSNFLVGILVETTTPKGHFEINWPLSRVINGWSHQYQAVGALGELSDKSDFSLLAWDSFSQEIRDLFTVVRSITYILLSKLFEFTWNAVIFFLKKKNCVIFMEKIEKQNKSRKNKLKI